MARFSLSTALEFMMSFILRSSVLVASLPGWDDLIGFRIYMLGSSGG